MAIVVASVALLARIETIRIFRGLVLLGAFVGWCWMAFLASAQKDAALDPTWTFTKVWLISFIGYNVIRSQRQWKFFLAFALCCFLLFPLRGAFINYFGGNSTFGRALWNRAYGNPNDLAGFGILFLGFAGALTVLSKSLYLRLAGLGAASLILTLILFTQSRGALVGIALAVSIGFWSKLRNPRVVGALAVMVMVGAMAAPASVWERLGGLANMSLQGGMRGVDEEGSAEQRYQIMQIAARMTAAYPAMGVGVGAYSVVHARLATEAKSEFHIAGGKRDAHNSFLRASAETGFPGLALFIVILLSAFMTVRTVRQRSDAVHAEAVRLLRLGLIAFVTAGLFGSYTYLTMLYLYITAMELSVTNAAPVMDIVSSTRRQRATFRARGAHHPQPRA
ncbi:O-antigen ligase family protein [Gemmatimonas sp.]|uniref:O-antigen ligase family protein n=1 Tax=Gemmatimonas sp. TaxID=1962908 RepID=UPI00356696CC